ncbi:FAD-dependent oxidoreductase [Leptolyngbya sp. AN02str]|uniref:FAD-dependent oxidoreductase n=1 Tax=Leptolyngbya sp. AN02str TaxID=3423363 RepID=UPI003D31123A
MIKPLKYPIVVIGGGFYGCSLASHLADQGASVVLIEQASDLLTRASYHNQARLHGGYHYPRSFSTAYRSRLNFARFLHEFRPAIATEFVKLYAIARHHSKVSPRQFETFCQTIEAPIQPARKQFTQLFSPRAIAAVYETQEYAFDAAVLRRLLRQRLDAQGVIIKCNTKVIAIQPHNNLSEPLDVIDDVGNHLCCSYVVNCTYAGLNQIQGIQKTHHQLKHEITEMALVQLPEEIQDISVTVMDGPFFSFMPFPDRRLSTLSHVRYTPHSSWLESTHPELNPYEVLAAYSKQTTFGFMLRDAQRFMPCLGEARHCDSLFEVKTVLVRNEGDDGRPILFEKNTHQPNIISVLGSKIDNIYDAFIAASDVFS